MFSNSRIERVSWLMRIRCRAGISEHFHWSSSDVGRRGLRMDGGTGIGGGRRIGGRDDVRWRRSDDRMTVTERSLLIRTVVVKNASLHSSWSFINQRVRRDEVFSLAALALIYEIFTTAHRMYNLTRAWYRCCSQGLMCWTRLKLTMHNSKLAHINLRLMSWYVW